MAKFGYDPEIISILRLDTEIPTPQEMEHYGSALAGALRAVSQGRKIKAVFEDPQDLAAPVSLTWKEGETERYTMRSAEGRHLPQTIPVGGHRQMLRGGGKSVDDQGVFDKIFDALRHRCQVGAYRSNGLAVIAWDRQSHGNHPGVTLDEAGWVTCYHELPAEIWADFRMIHVETKQGQNRSNGNH